ncbi:DUF885 domain-containing protein [Sphingosinicella sp. LHD-64]|uniref:DUF885 domain-containing protein n=1 Tax=Sphingosinicella sp. LHD-64 TaxID=3072139 RepID=UPI00280FFDDC|nr:DUF885 domain-containing protein [Sphingosinicella sp. LHD-64]MDQ8757205.1 DUF885 domain-containing protein [Sphingosinicella sp. LHD-64]
MRRFSGRLLAAAAALSVAGAAAGQGAPAGADAALDALADRLVQLLVAYDPTQAYSIGVPAPDHRRWPDRRPEAVAAYERASDEILDALRGIDPARLSTANRFVHAGMVERLDANRAERVCRFDLWAVNHMGGWHLGLAEVARDQPVATADERAQAIERWSTLPAMIDQEIANARTGLAQGYSAPKAVVARVIRQIDGILAARPESLPFYAPAERADDLAFKTRLREVLAGPVHEAFGRYRRFLGDDYLPRAREALGVSANPDGTECYRASLRSYTTLDRSPEAVFNLGRETVNGNQERVRALGREAFGTDDPGQIVQRIPAAPDNRFTSEDELIAFSRAAVVRARARTARLFLEMPAQEIRVEPFHAYRRGSGGSSYYELQIDPALPAFYRINSEVWANETRGTAEITAVHESYPGHHMQISLAAQTSTRPISKLLFNSAFIEGWGRYSEALAEEAGIYETRYAPMTRRLWPARGMVVDPGLHVMGWTRQQVIDFIRASGRFPGAEADDLVDRIAILPGQLTAYDSGGLEIMALRREAEEALGPRFDVRQFHQRVLENGTVPLGALRDHVRAWIAAQRAQ